MLHAAHMKPKKKPKTPSPEQVRAGKELKRIRETELKLTQMELAEHMGVTRETVTRWEIGKRPIPAIAEKLLGFLRASKGVLMKS